MSRVKVSSVVDDGEAGRTSITRVGVVIRGTLKCSCNYMMGERGKGGERERERRGEGESVWRKRM